MKKIIKVAEKCMDCQDQPCVSACIQSHRECEEIGWGHLYITKDQKGGLPIVCEQCEDAPCVNACNRKALVRNGQTGAIVVDKYGCNLCGLCISACPYGLISGGRDIVYKCDLCKGEPKCVSACPCGALLSTNNS